MSLATLRSIKRLSVGVIPLFMAAHSLPVVAADDDLVLEEIVVTATRQATGSQSTPLALTAISGEDLEKQGVTSLQELGKLAPSLYVQEGISAAAPRFSLRGISGQDLNFNGNSPVALYFDDVYQTAAYGIAAQLFDIGRVEVLRGPQGTLFGKNTTGGAISYFSKEPVNADEGYVNFKFGSGDQTVRDIEGAFNTAITDTLAARVSIKADKKGDYVQDAFNSREYGHERSESIRAQLKWTPSDDTSANLTLASNSGGGTAQILHAQLLPNACNPFIPGNNGAAFYLCDNTLDFSGPFPVPQIGTPQAVPALSPDIASNSPSSPNDEDYSNQYVTLRVNQKVGDFNLTSISNYKRGRFYLFQDAEGAPGDYLNLVSKQRSQQISEELRLATDPAQPLSAVVGLYYQHDRLQDADSFNSIAGIQFTDYNQSQYFTNKTTTYALFTSVTYKITDQWTVVGGVRKSDEKKTIGGAIGYYDNGNTDWTVGNVIPTSADMVGANDVVLLDQKVKASPVTWDATVKFQPVEDTQMFVRVAKSFRSGGITLPPFIDPRDPNDPSTPQFPNPGFKVPPGPGPTFKPEYITSYEVGIKSEWLNHTLRTNATVYHYKFADQQVQVFQGGVPETQNAGDSKVDGIELEVKALPMRALELDGSVSYTKAKYKKFITKIPDDLTGGIPFLLPDVDLAGKTLPQAPKWTATAGVAYTFDVSDSYGLRASTNWQYRSEVFFTPQNNPDVMSAGVTTGNVRLELAPQDGKGVSFGAYADNVTNRKPVTYGFALPPVMNSVVYGTGRKYGLEMKYEW